MEKMEEQEQIKLNKTGRKELAKVKAEITKLLERNTID